MIIDTHSHLQFDAYQNDLEAVLQRTREAGIACINVGTDFVSSKKAVEFSEKYDGSYAAVGLHPTDIDEALNLENYKKLVLSASRRVVAIGEIGLDFFRKPYDEQKQRNTFLQQLALAKELNLPVIIHCRAAHDQMIEILKAVSSKLKANGVIHCFTGTLEQAQKYVALGFCLGVGGIIFKFNIDKVVKAIPLEKLLLETDCPYLTPPMAESQRNEPIFIKHTIQKIAELKGVSFERVAEITTQNAKKLFTI